MALRMALSLAFSLALTLAPTAVVHAGVSAKLAKRIDAAIRRGRTALLGRLEGIVERPANDYPMGRIALPLAAVIKAGTSPEQPLAKKAFARLRALPLKKTYSVSCYLFALDAAWNRKYEQAFLGAGRTRVPADPRARGDVGKEIARAVDWLVHARAEGRGYWSYDPQSPSSGRHDYSNTQFAVLGLGIGVEHGVAIPQEVFEEIANRFLATHVLEGKARTVRFRLASSPGFDRPGRTRTRAVTGRNVRPGGWCYKNKGAPYPSMTAAGTSSLLIARAGLKGNPPLRAAIDRALIRAYGWIGGHFEEFIRGKRHHYYTLYSLEKVGDLGEVETFEDFDWYAEGAKQLVAEQRADGSWHGGGRVYVDTSFALLFLTRATRLKPSAPTILTRAGDADDGSGDLVFIRRLGGFISAGEVFRYIAKSRRPSLVELGREVVRHYAPGRRAELVPGLLALWSGKDRVTAFARSALQEITRLRSSKREDFVAWREKYGGLLRLERGAEVSAQDVASWLDRVENEALKERALDVASRRHVHGLAERLIRELEDASPAYRRKIHGLLVLWTGQKLRRPQDGDEKGWERLRAEWQAWWQREGGTFQKRVEARRIVERIERLSRSGNVPSGGPVERELEGLVKTLAGIGEPALAPLRTALRAQEYSFYLVEALEEITGQRVGLRAEL
ncbi:MAG: hypothetical protein O7J95_08155 [Planctomycetota bacterium]|nr:hypothetical protein [Planctomycetota bacterium]